jgi:HNH endonuclease
LKILNMFDRGVSHVIEASGIDEPWNAITLAPQYHKHFGDFDIFFTELFDQPPNTYNIDSFHHRHGLQLPVTRTLEVSDDVTIEPPSPRLLALHSAIAHILHLSAAGDYIDKVLEEMDAQEMAVLADPPSWLASGGPPSSSLCKG